MFLPENVVNQVGRTRGVRVNQPENPDFRDGGHIGIQCPDDLHQTFDVGRGVGDDQGVAIFVGFEAGIFRHQSLQVLLERGGGYVADGDHVGDDIVAGDNDVGVPAGEDGNVLFLGVLKGDDFKHFACEHGRQALLFQCRVDQRDRLVQRDRLAADDGHAAVVERLVRDNCQSCGLGQVLQDGL